MMPLYTYIYVYAYKSTLGETAETSLSVGKMTLKNRNLAGAEEYASQRACRNKATNETELKGKENNKLYRAVQPCKDRWTW